MANFNIVSASKALTQNAEWSIAQNAAFSTSTPRTSAGKVTFTVDLSALAAGDVLELRVYRGVNGTTPVQADLATVKTATIYSGELQQITNAWDVTLKLTSATGRTVTFEVIQDTNDVNANTITAGAIVAASFAAGAITSTVLAAGAITSSIIAASAIGATQLASAAITAAKFAVDAIDAATLAASAVAEIQSGLALAATAVSSADLTPTRAAALDRLDVAVSGRASATAAADIQARIPATLDGAGNMKAGVQTIAAGAITAAATATDFLTAVTGAVWSLISEGAETVLHQLRLLRAREIGKATVRDGDGTYIFRDAGDTKDRLVMARSGTARTTTTADGT